MPPITNVFNIVLEKSSQHYRRRKIIKNLTYWEGGKEMSGFLKKNSRDIIRINYSWNEVQASAQGGGFWSKSHHRPWVEDIKLGIQTGKEGIEGKAVPARSKVQVSSGDADADFKHSDKERSVCF